MKTCKKALAIILSLVMAMSAMVFTVSADDEPAVSYVQVSFIDAKVTETAEDDDLIVKQIQMKVTEADPMEGVAPPVFDKVDTETEIYIIEEAYELLRIMSEGADSENINMADLTEEACVAKAKAVSCVDNVITFDIFDKEGNRGAKLAQLVINGAEGFLNSVPGLAFLVPDGLVQDSVSGKINMSGIFAPEIEGLAKITVELPSLITKLLNSLMGGNVVSVIAGAIFLLPVILISASAFMRKVDKYFAIYGFTTRGMLFKVIRNLL